MISERLFAIQEAVLRFETEFRERLSGDALWPDADEAEDDEAHEAEMYDLQRYIPSDEAQKIARFFFMYRATNIRDKATLEGFFEGHNERIDALLEDREALRRERIPPKRYQEARFSKNRILLAIGNAIVNDFSGFDGNTLSSLLVEQANKEQVHNTMKALARVGFFEVLEGPYGSNVYVSQGKIEGMYETCLKDLATRIAALPKA